MVKVALLVFNPFVNDSRVLKEAYSLQKHYDVHIVAHQDKGLREEENIDGLQIHRFSYLDRRETKQLFGKLRAYIVYIKQSVQFGKNCDILHCNDLNTLPVGVIVKRFLNRQIKIVYDAHEYETEINGLFGIKKIVIQKLEKFLIRHVDRVITVSDAIAEEYVNLYGIQKPALVLNTPPYTELIKQNLFRETLQIDEDKTIFLYQGNLTKGRGIEAIIETFKQIQNDKDVIIFMGYGPLENDIQKAAMVSKSIYFHPAVNPEVLLDYTSSADFGISTIEDTCLSYRYCLPNKMFEYIMAEVPVIVSNLPEMKKVVETHKVGIITKNNGREALKVAIREIAKLDKKELNTNIKKAKNIFNWEKQEKDLIDLYRTLYV